MNFSSPVLFVGLDLLLLPMCIMLAVKMRSSLVLSCLLLGITGGTLSTLFRHVPNVFAGGFLGGKRKTLAELHPEALKVLSFFRSKQARHMTLIISATLAGLSIASWSVAVRSPATTSFNTESLLAAALGTAVFAYFIALGNHLILLSWYALVNWQKIQQQYPTWPVDQPYDPLRRRD